MTAAVENVEYSISVARKTARRFDSGVTIEFKTYAGEPGQVIAFTPGKRGVSAGIPEYRLPADVELLSNRASFVFDHRGLVKNPGTIILVSRVDGSVTETIPVN